MTHHPQWFGHAAFVVTLGAAEKSGDLSYLLQLQTLIARSQGLQDHFDQFHRTLDEVEKRLGPQVPVAPARSTPRPSTASSAARSGSATGPRSRTSSTSRTSRA
jgi:hypothetical protein